jgi:hypothetical protein
MNVAVGIHAFAASEVCSLPHKGGGNAAACVEGGFA